MKSVTRIALIAPFLLLVAACDNGVDAGVDPVVGEYELVLFNDLVMPVSQVQTAVGNGAFCDFERRGTVSFSENLDLSLSVQERFFNCTDINLNDEDTILLLGSGAAEEVGSSYSVLTRIDDRNVNLDCNLQGDNLFCQGANGPIEAAFQGTRVE